MTTHTASFSYQGALTSQRLSDEQKDWFRTAAKHLGVDIDVRYGAGRSSVATVEEAEQRSNLLIYDFSTLEPNVTPEQYDYIYLSNDNYIELKQRYLLHPSSLYPVMDIDGGENGSFLFGNHSYKTIWSGLMLCNFSPDQYTELLFPYMEQSLEADYYKDQKEQQRTNSVKNMLKSMKASAQAELKKSKQEVDMLIASVSSTEQTMINQLRNLARAQEKFIYAEKQANKEVSKYEEQIQEVMNNVNYEKVEFNSRYKTIDIITNQLMMYTPDKKERVKVGKFQIRYSPTNGTVKITNLTMARGGRQHPHVDAAGQPCWGSMGTQIAKLSAAGELIALFELIVMYLEKYNPADDWGRFASYWWEKEPVEYLCHDGQYRTKAKLEHITDVGKRPVDEDTKKVDLPEATFIAELTVTDTGGTPN